MEAGSLQNILGRFLNRDQRLSPRNGKCAVTSRPAVPPPWVG